MHPFCFSPLSLPRPLRKHYHVESFPLCYSSSLSVSFHIFRTPSFSPTFSHLSTNFSPQPFVCLPLSTPLSLFSPCRMSAWYLVVLGRTRSFLSTPPPLQLTAHGFSFVPANPSQLELSAPFLWVLFYVHR